MSVMEIRTWSMPVMRGRAGRFCARTGAGSNSHERTPQKQIPRFARDDSAEKSFCGELGIGDPTESYFAILVEALAEALLEALVGGLVVGAAGEIVGEAGHGGDCTIDSWAVLLALPLADALRATASVSANDDC